MANIGAGHVLQRNGDCTRLGVSRVKAGVSDNDMCVGYSLFYNWLI
jgi:hypothetical protein